MSRRDVGSLLTRALVESAVRSAVTLDVALHGSRRWSSATFTGARHTLTLTGPRSLDADTWIGELEDADLPVRGHLVADVKVLRIERSDDAVTAEIEALTLEDR